MSDKKKHIDAGPDNFQRYSGNRMTEKERNAFERMLEQDPFAAEAADGFSRLSGDELAADLQELKERAGLRKNKGRRWVIYSAAAAVISILIISTFFLRLEVPREKSLSGKVMEQEMANNEVAPMTDTMPENRVPLPVVSRDKKETGKSAGISREKSRPAIEKEEKAAAEVAENNGFIDMEAEIDDETEYDFAVVKKLDDGAGDLPSVAGVTDESIPVPAGAKARAAEFKDGGIVSTVTIENKRPKYPDRSYRISGTVYSSEDGSPIPGVAVMKKGTGSGVITDMDGNFHLSFDEKDTEPVLEARLVGLNPEEVKVSKQDTTLKIEMEPSLTAMDEVVVIGYGISDARNESGSVTIIRPDDDIPPVYNPACPVTGRVAFEEYIEKNMVFPDGYPELSRAVVILRFTVGDNSRPMAIEVVKSPGVQFSVEAIRLLNAGPDWLPPTRDNVPINERQRLRLVFKKPL